MRTPTHDDVLRASARLAGRVVRTPVLRHRELDQLAGATVLVKAECLQKTGSFKLRGATNAILEMPPETRQGGVVAFSSGNHGQAVACAAAQYDVRATIVMPHTAPKVKVEATRAWGAEIVFYDPHTQDRAQIATDLAARTGAVLVPPFDHPDVIAGQGTMALEFIRDAVAMGCPMDLMLVGTGGGGLMAGCGLAVEGMSPQTRLCAVEPEEWNDFGLSLAAGHRVAVPGGSRLCDSLLTPQPGELTFAINRTRVTQAVTVSDAQVLQAMAFAFRTLKLVLEPGGAIGLAAALSGAFAAPGRKIGVVISGGNVDAETFTRALAN